MRIDANSIALVTGANRARGIGLALVRELLARGCGKVLGTYREATNSQALLDLAKVDERVNAHPLDLTMPASAKVLAEFCARNYDHLDLLINNAGMGSAPGDSIVEAAIEDYENELQVHAIGPLRLTQLLWPLLKKNKLPVIVNVSSTAGQMRHIGSDDLFYGPAKVAQNAISLQMAENMAGKAVVIPMHPGWVATDMGGTHAPVSPQDSARGILDYVEKALPTDNGCFVDFRGKELPWA